MEEHRRDVPTGGHVGEGGGIVEHALEVPVDRLGVDLQPAIEENLTRRVGAPQQEAPEDVVVEDTGGRGFGLQEVDRARREQEQRLPQPESPREPRLLVVAARDHPRGLA